MKKKYLMTLLIGLFLFSFGSSALAISDNVGEHLVTACDIQDASVEVFDKTDPENPPEKAKLGIRMASGSHLPGAVIWDFDVDNDSATGGGSITGISLPPCGPGGCKQGQGYDFFVVMVLRTQSDTSNLSICSNCSRADNPAESCSEGMVKGEWYAGLSDQPGLQSFARGNIYLPASWNVLNENELCAEIPWATILANAITEGANFDPSYAINEPPKFQVSAWHDEDFADGEDLFDIGEWGLYLNISDWLPDSTPTTDAKMGNETCYADYNKDGKVDIFDLLIIKNEFGRNQFINPCPGCN